ncbi:MAG: hypothetical protein WD669_06315, partial [Pirellulales bacterium]
DVNNPGVLVHLLGDYQQTAGQMHVVSSATLQIDGMFTQSGAGDFLVTSDANFEVNGTFTSTSTGTFNIHDATFSAGATEINTASIAFGSQATTGNLTAHGTVLVEHAGTMLHVQGNYLQDGGNFHVIGSATMNVNGSFSYMAGNTLEVRGNSTLTTGNTTSGISVANSVLVDSGGKATIGHLTAHGNVTVNNPTSVLRVGGDYFQDAGGFAIGDTATLNVDGSFRYLAGGPTFINFGNGLLRVGRQLTLEEGHFWNLTASGGRVRVGDGLAAPAEGSVEIAANGTLAGNGTIIGSVTNSGGTIAPGDSPGRLDITGNYSQAAAANLLVEIGGPLAELQYDQLVISGSAALAGKLDVDLVNLGTGVFAPVLGQSFDVLRAGGTLTGTFSILDLPLLSPGLTWNTTYLAHVVRLSVVAQPVLAGDYNQDGTVNAADYTVWRNHLGQTFNLPNKNPLAETPNIVDREDFNFWKSRYAQTHGSGALAGSFDGEPAVPEPTSLVLFILAFVATAAWAGRARLRLPNPLASCFHYSDFDSTSMYASCNSETICTPRTV